jgi:hypothetical protein
MGRIQDNTRVPRHTSEAALLRLCPEGIRLAVVEVGNRGRQAAEAGN